MAKDSLTTGNVPVKVGVIVSFFGVAFLLRYAVDQGYLVISIEARYLAVTAIAAVLLAIGWREMHHVVVVGLIYEPTHHIFRVSSSDPTT